MLNAPSDVAGSKKPPHPNADQCRPVSLFQESCPLLYFSLFLGWAGKDNNVGYSPERKNAVQKPMLPPNNMAIRQLS
jgi:hypothetical protein